MSESHQQILHGLATDGIGPDTSADGLALAGKVRETFNLLQQKGTVDTVYMMAHDFSLLAKWAPEMVSGLDGCSALAVDGIPVCLRRDS